MLLRMKDIQPAMQDKWLQLYWPDDGKWWPAQVSEVDTKAHRAHLLYETGKLALPCKQFVSYYLNKSSPQVIFVLHTTVKLSCGNAQTVCLLQ